MPDPFANIRFIREVRFAQPEGAEADRFPFTLPCLRNLRSLNIHPHVTFFIGENGSGKSTLIEAIAAEWGMNPEGGGRNFTFSTRATHSILDKHITLVKGIERPRTNYFLRAESFYNLASNVDDLGVSGYGPRSLHAHSHGESFLALLEHRFWPKGLYILDEPEAALSPTGQLRFLARLHELVQQGSQFLIATHSPIIMAYPDAWIYEIGEDGLRRTEYEETDHYRITRGFLAAPRKRLHEITGIEPDAPAPPVKPDPFSGVPYIREVRVAHPGGEAAEEYPFSLACVRRLDRLELHPRVTFLIGENGSGKSTLIEAIAVAWGMNAEGGSSNFSFATRATHSCLDEHLTLLKGIKRPRTNYYLRAESTYNVATNIDEMDEIDCGSPPVIDYYGGVSLHEQSHGESFLALLEHRFGPRGLYILDEPESALSPTGQLIFLARLHELAQEGSQFIIATHSPVIMAYPDAWLYEVGEDGLRRTEYEETTHYRITRGFLTAPEQRLREVMGGV